MRGREFIMKDMYSFHKNEEDLLEYYGKAKNAYMAVFDRVGLKAYYTLAQGGDFTISNTHEFQVLSETGEDVIYYKEGEDMAYNEEVKERCKRCKSLKLSKKQLNRSRQYISIGYKILRRIWFDISRRKWE